MRVTVIGTGYASALSRRVPGLHGRPNVTCVDVECGEKSPASSEAIFPIYEPGLPELLRLPLREAAVSASRPGSGPGDPGGAR